MQLPQFFRKKEDSKDSYFGLFLRSESAVGFVFEIENNEVRPVAKELIKYSNGWQNIVDDIDQLLSILENETNITVSSCIYFVYSYFVDSKTGDLQEPYKGVMRRISKELELKPLGYIECHEAIKEMFEKEEGVPLNCVLVEVDARHVCLYVYKGGKLIHSDNSPRTDSVAEDIAAIVERKEDQFLLPSRMIVYGSGSLTSELDALRMYTWKDDVFIQTPRIYGLGAETVLNALSATFMEQINGEFPEEMIDEDLKDLPQDNPDMPATTISGSMAPEPEKDISDILTIAEDEGPLTDSVPRQQRGKDHPSKKAKNDTDDEEDEAEKVGFFIGTDVADLPDLPAKQTPALRMGFLKDRKLPTLPAISLPKAGGKQVVAVVSVLAILGGLGAAQYFLHTSTVEVYLPSETISETVALEASTGRSSIVSADTTTIEISDSIATSGQREVGEKAKGTVTLYNFDDRQVTIQAGTELKVDSLVFTLDSNVEIASRSGSVASRTAGTKDASVTAVAIGAESNIAKDKQLNIPSLGSRDVYAVAKETFTGGSKRKVQTVAKTDIAQLEKRVLAKAQEQSEVKLKSASGGKLLSDLTEFEITKAKYSGEVGQEADEVTVSATVEVRYYLAKDETLRTEILGKLSNDVPSGFKIDTDKISYRITSSQKVEDTINMNVLGEAVAVKQVDPAKIARSLVWKSKDEARKILREEFEVEDVVVRENHSPLFFLSGLLPLQPGNITVEFKIR
ncbi:MAG: baseplate J/gp47 family protein [Patescibacteria group bacterium]|nr:baseplate J/gp47 family protein [Patescibacteria group bacterium]